MLGSASSPRFCTRQGPTDDRMLETAQVPLLARQPPDSKSSACDVSSLSRSAGITSWGQRDEPAEQLAAQNPADWSYMIRAGGHAVPSAKAPESGLALGGRPDTSGAFALSRSVFELVAAFPQDDALSREKTNFDTVEIDIPIDADASSSSVSALRNQVLRLQAVMDGVVLEAFNHLRQEQQDLTARVELFATRERGFPSMKFEAFHQALSTRVDALEAHGQDMAAACERSERRLERVRAEVGELRSHGLLCAARIEQRIQAAVESVDRLAESVALKSHVQLATSGGQDDAAKCEQGAKGDRKVESGEDFEAKRPGRHRAVKRRVRRTLFVEHFPKAKAAMESLQAVQ